MNREREPERGMAVAPVLLYDGECAACAGIVRFILGHENRDYLRFAPLGGEVAGAVRQRHSELAGVDSAIWVDNPGADAEAVAIGSEAVLKVGRYLGWPWRLLGAGRLLPERIRQSVYQLVARHRHRLPFGRDQCTLPDDADKARFLP